MIEDDLRARAQQDMGNKATMPPPVRMPEFRSIIEKLEKMRGLTSEMNRRSKDCVRATFGMQAGDEIEQRMAERAEPIGFMDTTSVLIDEIFSNLGSIEQDINKFSEELGSDA